MSSTAGPARIILPIEIELDKATAQLQGFRRTAVDEVGAAAKVIEADLSKAEKSATTLGTSTVTAAKGMRQEMQGASAAVGGVMQAINLLGVQAPPQIGGISRAFSSLLATGINPLGIALAGATGLIAIWASLTKETDKATTSIERQTQAWEGLRAEIEKTAATAAAGRAGMSASMFQNTRRLGDLEALRGSIEDARANTPGLSGVPQARQDQFLAEQFSPRLRGLGIIGEGQTPDGAALQRLFAEIMDARKTIADAAALAREMQPSVTADLEYQAQRNAEVRALLARFHGSTPELPGSALGEAITRQGLGDQSALERMDRQARIVEERRQQEVLDRAAGRAQGMLDESRSPFPWQSYYGPATPDNSQMAPQSMRSPITVPSYASGLNRQMQESTERSVTQGIADALSPDRNKGAFERFALAMADTLRTRIAQGLADALLGNGKNFGGGGLLGSIFGGGAGGNNADGTGPFGGAKPPSGAQVVDPGTTTYYSTPLGPGKRAMKAEDSTPIVVMVGVDEASADHILSKASGRGARAVYVKSQGGGVGAGMIPGRRK